MHALLPEPATFSNSCMPCCQSLRLSQIHACPAARAGRPVGRVQKFIFHTRDLSRNRWAAAARTKDYKNALSQPPRPKNALSQPPRPKKCSFTASPPQNTPFHSLHPESTREKTGSILCFSMVITKCNNSSRCCGGFHSRSYPFG